MMDLWAVLIDKRKDYHWVWQFCGTVYGCPVYAVDPKDLFDCVERQGRN